MPIIAKPQPTETYVVVVYNKYDSDDIDFIAGPFDTAKEARAWDRANIDHTYYRNTSVEKLRLTLPEWCKEDADNSEP